MRFQEFILTEDIEILYTYHPLAFRQMMDPLYEVFDADVGLKIANDSEDYFTATFTIENEGYFFMAKKNKEDIWSISFDVASRRDDSSIYDLMKTKKLPVETFSAVIKCVDYLKEHKKLIGIIFNSEIPEMIKLYDSMSKYIEKKLNMAQIDRFEKDGLTYWKYLKKDNE